MSSNLGVIGNPNPNIQSVLHLTALRQYDEKTEQEIFLTIDRLGQYPGVSLKGVVAFLTPKRDHHMRRKFFVAAQRLSLVLDFESQLIELASPEEAWEYVEAVIADGVCCVVMHDALENIVEQVAKRSARIPIIDTRLVKHFSRRYMEDRSARRTNEKQPMSIEPQPWLMCYALLKLVLP